MFNLGFGKSRPVAAALGIVLLAAGATRAAPVENYGKLPDIEDVSLSPDGTQLAYAGALGDDRIVSVIRIGGSAPPIVLPTGKVKLRSIKWADDDHLIITKTTTSNGGAEVVSETAERAQAFIYDLKRKRLDLMELRDEHTAMNVVLGVPMVRKVGDHNLIYFSTVTFLDGHGRPSLYTWDDRTSGIHLVDDGNSDLEGYAIDAKGVEVAQVFYKEPNWTLKAKIAGAWRTLPPIDAPIDRPSVAAVRGDDDALLVYGKVEGEEGWHSLSLKDGSWTLLEDWAGDGLLTDPQTGQPLGRVRTGDRSVYTFFDPALDKSWKAIVKAFPGEQVDYVSSSNDRKKFVVRVFGKTTGAAYMLVDLKTGQGELIGDTYKSVPPEQVAETSSLTYKAADGLEIMAYLTLPRGREAKNLPLVVLPHGGPESRDDLAFDWWAQALASRGYAVLQPQFRGSEGFGREFIEKGYGQWGRKMQTDVSDGVKFLAAKGTIDAKRTCIVGASYGGYAALAGVTLESGLYRCAVSVAGPSDLKRMLDWEVARHPGSSSTLKYFDRYMGAESQHDPSLGEISPITFVSKISAPVLIIHGKDDTVVPFEQSQVMVNAMKAAGKPVEFIALDGEDHWLSRSETRLRMLEATVKFLEANNPPDLAPSKTATATP